MIFILVFVAAMLLVPVMIDIERHGTDNVLRRSAEDILQFSWIATPLRTVNQTLTVAGCNLKRAAIVVTKLVFAYIALSFLDYVIRLFWPG